VTLTFTLTGDHPGTEQADQLDSHTHGNGADYLLSVQAGATSLYHGDGSSVTTATGGNETRMKNTNWMFCIWY
jgi:hypothetical protein